MFLSLESADNIYIGENIRVGRHISWDYFMNESLVEMSPEIALAWAIRLEESARDLREYAKQTDIPLDKTLLCPACGAISMKANEAGKGEGLRCTDENCGYYFYL
jgi:hypothetical protein